MAIELDWEQFLAPNDMEWVVKPVSWDEGAFLGNGLIGAMIYGEEHAKKRHVLRFITGRTDVTAVRTDRPGFLPVFLLAK
ncbi:glycoside hydrolase family 95 protein [Paenibacillus sp. CC-CFT747]|nr:glycoside hydrolase family 95 protein [Paenibacillus sp. CC-CFT747]